MVVVAPGTCFHGSLDVCSFPLDDLTAKAKTSSGLLSLVTCGMFFAIALIWLSSARNSMISFLNVMDLEKVPLVFMIMYF